MPPRKVTIEDISQRTGLSRGTVSRALNDRPDISQRTKQRVLDACRELNYIPSHAARSLATGRNYAVTVIVSRLDDPFESAYLRGVLAQAVPSHYGVYVLELGRDEPLAEQRLRALSAERLDAALVASDLSRPLHALAADVLGPRRIAGVTEIDGATCDVLGPDWVEVGRLAARYLLERGARRPLFLHDPGDQRMLAGLREVLEAGGVAAAGVIVEANGALDTPGVRGRVLDAEAIAASSDALAISVLPLLAEAGRRPGRDVHVLGCGNCAVGRSLHPPLSTIDLSGEEIGKRSAQLVFDRLAGTRMDAPQRIAVAPRLELRGTGS